MTLKEKFTTQQGLPLNSKTNLLLLLVAFVAAACGVKKPPLPQNSQPAMYEKYLDNSYGNKKLEEDEEKQKKN